MLKRTITGGVIFLVTLLFVVLKQFSPLFFDAYLLLIMYGAIYEMYKVHQMSGKQADFISICFIPLVACIIFNLEKNPVKNIFYVVLIALVVMSVVLIEDIVEFRDNRKYGTTEKNINVLNQKLFLKTRTTMAVFAYPILPLLMLMVLNHIDYDLAYIGIIATFAVSMLTDTCAYFVGRFLGKTKFIPEVSPNKTIAGVFGGFAGGLIGALSCFFLFYYTDIFALATYGSMGLLITVFILIGILGSLINQLGDLIASAYKRKYSIKDFSNIFPGHGGFMDRVDGLMFTGSFILVLFIIFLV